MPKKLPKDEEKFLRYYVREGGVAEKIVVAERAARLKAGTGAKMLKLKRVQDALRERLEPLRLEQQRQELVGAAVAEATAKQQEELNVLRAEATKIKTYENLSIQGNTTLLEQELMRVALGLDMNVHGRVKLEYIKTALVIGGLMEQGTTRRVGPTEMDPSNKAPSVYAAVFNRLRDAENNHPVPVEVMPDSPTIEGVFDLVPVKAAAVVPTATAMPPAGESIDAPVPVARKESRVMTVEIG